MFTRTSLVLASFLLLIGCMLNFRTKQTTINPVNSDQQASVQTEQAGDRTPKSGDGRREFFLFSSNKAEPNEESANNSCDHRGSGRICPEQACPNEISQFSFHPLNNA